MDIARGGFDKNIPSGGYPAISFYSNINADSCDSYECQVQSFITFGITTIMGMNDNISPWRSNTYNTIPCSTDILVNNGDTCNGFKPFTEDLLSSQSPELMEILKNNTLFCSCANSNKNTEPNAPNGVYEITDGSAALKSLDTCLDVPTIVCSRKKDKPGEVTITIQWLLILLILIGTVIFGCIAWQVFLFIAENRGDSDRRGVRVRRRIITMGERRFMVGIRRRLLMLGRKKEV